MLEELTFGEYVFVKRRRLGLSKKEMAAKLSLSATYYSNIENGVRPAPARVVQKNIATVLGLSAQEKEHLFDLAVMTKKKKNIPLDICEYIERDENVKLFLRKARKLGASGNDLLKLI